MSDLKPYTIEYRHKDKRYTAEIYASDDRDARQRMNSIYYNGYPQEVVYRADDSWLTKFVRWVMGEG